MHRILLLDDDIELCDLLTEYLRPEGFEILVAHDGEEGLAAALSSPVDLVLLDVMLPKLDGWGVLAARRRRGRNAAPRAATRGRCARRRRARACPARAR